MNSKQLFMLIDKIDERFIDEAWGNTESENFDEIDYENRRGVNVVMERRPLCAVGFALTAACFLLLGAGGMSLINLFTGNGIQPNNSTEIPPLYGESSSESSESSEPSEPIESSTFNESVESGESSEYSEPDELNSEDELLSQHDGVYELYYSIPPGGEVHSNASEKPNNWEYAVIEVKETNATEDFPIIAQILKSQSKGGMEPISEEIYITAPGTYEIRYTTLRGAGSFSYLYLAYPDWYDYGETNHEAIIVGTWSP